MPIQQKLPPPVLLFSVYNHYKEDYKVFHLDVRFKAVFDSLKKRSLFQAIWLAVENSLRNQLERWAPFWLRFESSNISNLQVERFLRESKTDFIESISNEKHSLGAEAIEKLVKLQKKQCGGVYFWLYGIAYWMPIQQKLPPPVLLFSDFASWGATARCFSPLKKW